MQDTSAFNNPVLKEESIDIKKYLYMILRNWFWFVAAIVMGVGAAYLSNRYSDPIYQVGMTIIVEGDENSSYSSNNNLIEGFNLFQQGKKIENEIAILKSYDLTRKAISELDFQISYFGVGRLRERPKYKIDEFIIDFDTAHAQVRYLPIYVTPKGYRGYQLEIESMSVNQFMKYDEYFENDDFRFRLVLVDSVGIETMSHDQYYFYLNSIEGLTARYRGKLSVEKTTEEGTVLLLSTSGHVPQQEINFLNKLAEVYIRSGLEGKNIIAENTIQFIDEQIADIADSLRNAEQMLQNFRLNNDIIDIDQEGRALFEQIEALQRQKAQELVHLKYYKYLKGYLSNPDQNAELLAPSLVGVNDNVLSGLVGRVNDLFAELQVLKFSTKRENPRVNLVLAKIATTQRALVESVSNLMKKSDMLLTDLDGRIEKVNTEIRKLPINERQLINIQRQFNLSDNIYTYLLEKRAEAGIKRASNISDAQILDKARSSSVYLISPKYRMNYILGLVIGFMIPLVIILLRDFFNTRIMDKKDIEDRTLVPILGVVGHNANTSEFIVKLKPKSSLAESFRSVKTNMEFLLLGDNSKIINITSAMSGEGKTFSSINLAAITAMTNKKTLLVGLDLRKPKLHTEFNVDNTIGLSTYLIGKHSLEDIQLATSIENLTLIPSGPTPVNPAQLIESGIFKVFIETIRKEYEFIIFDTPPAALVSDAMVLARYADANIFVVRQNYSNKNVIDLINDFQRNNKLPNMSILVNDVKLSGYYGNSYGYGYGSGYGYGYGYGENYYDDEFEKTSFKGRVLQIFNLK